MNRSVKGIEGFKRFEGFEGIEGSAEPDVGVASASWEGASSPDASLDWDI